MVADWIKEWAIPLSAGATFLLAIAAFLAIRQTRKLQKRERRDRLLNEIIEWAVEVAKSSIEPETPDLFDDKDAAKSWPFLAAQEKKLDTLQLLRAKSAYIAKIATETNPDLGKVTIETVENLSNQIKSLYEHKNFVSEYKSKKRSMDTSFLTGLAKNVEDNNKRLYESAVHVMEQSAKIRSGNTR